MAAPADPVLPAAALPPDAVSLVPIPPQRIPAAVAKLDMIIDGVLSKTGVPGLAAAVVHDGKLLYAKGFGIRDVNKPARVDPGTVFHLASVSKPLSSTVVAGAVGKGVVKWTDPIVPHLPSFALADPYVTAHVTYADLFSHVSGLPDHAGDLLEDLGYDQAYIFEPAAARAPGSVPGGICVHQLRPHGRRRGGRRRRWAVVARSGRRHSVRPGRHAGDQLPVLRLPQGSRPGRDARPGG